MTHRIVSGDLPIEPGPRVVETAEILAEIVHPGRCDFGHRGRGWVPWAGDGGD